MLDRHFHLTIHIHTEEDQRPSVLGTYVSGVAQKVMAGHVDGEVHDPAGHLIGVFALTDNDTADDADWHLREAHRR